MHQSKIKITNHFTAIIIIIRWTLLVFSNTATENSNDSILIYNKKNIYIHYAQRYTMVIVDAYIQDLELEIADDLLLNTRQLNKL